MDQVSTPSQRRLVVVAALCYVAGAAIESMEILEAPASGSAAAEIRQAYADTALATVKAAAGAFSLLSYAVFAVAIVGLTGARGRWRTLALGGALGAVAVAFAALIVAATLIGGDLGDGVVADRFDLALDLRAASAPLLAAFLLAAGTLTRRSGDLPAALGRTAQAIAVPLAAVPLIVFADAPGAALWSGIAFALQAVWVLAVGLWLAFADGGSAARFTRRCAFLIVALAAALIGIPLLAVPGATGDFFAWGLAPEPLAAYAGGVYLGSAVVYASSLPLPERSVRGLVLGAAVLSLSVLTLTLTHLDAFDLDRTAAWAWIVLFFVFSVVSLGLLAWDRGSPEEGDPRPLPAALRAAFAIAAALLGALALALWIDPVGLSGPAPFELSPLGGGFAGSWLALLATLVASAAATNRRDEGRLAALALLALPAGALLAALGNLSDLEPAAAAAGYMAALAALALVGAAALSALGFRDRRGS